MQTEFFNLTGTGFSRFEPTKKSLIELNRRLVSLKTLLVSEMNNPYVNSNDTINELWSIAYANVGELNQQIERSLWNIGGTELYLDTNKSEIREEDAKNIHAIIIREGGDIFTSFGALFGYTFIKIKKDKIRRGILDKNGKSKINPLTFYH